MSQRFSWRNFAVALAVPWLLVTLTRITLPLDTGLRGQYFADEAWSGAPVANVVDTHLSAAQMYGRWHADPPASFSVQWSGFLHVDRDGPYLFELTADDAARLFIDDTLVVDTAAAPGGPTSVGDLALTSGPHALRLLYVQHGGALNLRLRWGPDQQSLHDLRPWDVSLRSRVTPHIVSVWLRRVWLALTFAIAGVACAFGIGWFARRSPSHLASLAIRAALFGALGWFYLTAATAHANHVNTFKARADQTGYLVDAKDVYANWHGRTPHALVGLRMRMPMYAGFLALIYDPSISDDAFFELAKQWNIRLSLALLAAFCVIVSWELPALIATNLTLVVAFGCFVFRAGYSQPELLAYFLMFATFLGCLHLLDRGTLRRDLALAGLVGLLAGLTHLTKAIMPPFLGVFFLVYWAQELWRWWETRDAATLLARFAAGGLTIVVFLAVVWPYIANSKRVFGEYFFNVNTSVYLWYDSGAEARALLLPRTDADGRLRVSPGELPTASTYWRTHTTGQIAARLWNGVEDMVVRSYRTFGYLKYALLYLAIAAFLVATRARTCAAFIRQRWGVALFLGLYAAVFLTSTAFFETISGTGTTRFLMTHIAPFFFSLSAFFAASPFRTASWSVGTWRLSAMHLHALVSLAIAIDLAFFLWPRLMSTYGGF